MELEINNWPSYLNSTITVSLVNTFSSHCMALSYSLSNSWHKLDQNLISASIRPIVVTNPRKQHVADWERITNAGQVDVKNNGSIDVTISGAAHEMVDQGVRLKL
ncbi:hypothetical protein VNO77_03493 [Canavalia gladiata]|uniref:Uncharacterized protein n=1 Tax=Canavalia gladiata TaxID=3824 RepID=A0AAN9R6W9_CANGL